MKYTTITYVGKNPGYTVRIQAKTYEFEWNKSLAIGKRNDEVQTDHAKRISKWRDKKGKRIFILE
jgi:hypothetical protein